MITGIGTDLVEIDRIKRSLERYGDRFLDRIFTTLEKQYCLKHRQKEVHLAGRFAAKEAVAKALGTGFSHTVGWKDIEIINNSLGKPEVRLSPHLLAIYENIAIHISITHCRSLAQAFAVITKKAP